MQIQRLEVENYKGFHHMECALSSFTCAIGENNAGKSSLLQALLLFITGAKLPSASYYDPNADIKITVTLTGVSEAVLAKLSDEHRTKLTEFVQDETLVLARRYSPDGSSKLRHVTLVPRDPKYGDDQLESAFSGTRGNAIREVLKTTYG